VLAGDDLSRADGRKELIALTDWVIASTNKKNPFAGAYLLLCIAAPFHAFPGLAVGEILLLDSGSRCGGVPVYPRSALCGTSRRIVSRRRVPKSAPSWRRSRAHGREISTAAMTSTREGGAGRDQRSFRIDYARSIAPKRSRRLSTTPRAVCWRFYRMPGRARGYT